VKALQLAAILTSARRKADDSVAITFTTAQEIGTELFTQIDEYRKREGFVLFRANEFTAAEIPKENAKITGQVSDSQYLRKCLYAKHQYLVKTQQTEKDFDTYYHDAMMGFAQAVNQSIED
jgi:hypothetical protein